jgi:multidrug transporter EmrE-like cation transporter
MWPFLILAVVFFVLEVVTLVSSTGERQVLPALKDAVFVVIYVVLLIVAMRYSA